MRLDLLLARARLIEISQPSVIYCRENSIDFSATARACGGVFLAPIKPSGPRFDPRPGGTLAAWCDVLDEDGEEVLDAVAWPVGDPDRVLTLGARAPALGMARAIDPATYTFDQPLPLFRTPLAWLQTGCTGVVLLDHDAGARWLIDLPTSALAVEDWRHGGEIKRWLAAVASKRIIVPQRERVAA